MTTTVLYDDRVTAVAGARAAGDHLWLAPDDFAAATGWKLEPQGLCRGDACVRTHNDWLDADGRVDLTAFAAHMGQPVVHDGEAWAVGESAGVRRDALLSTVAPDFELPDLDGKLHKLSDYRGKKVYLYSWGSY